MNKYYRILILIISLAVPLLVGYLMYRPMTIAAEGVWLNFLPHFNAAINATTSLLLVLGFVFIKSGRISLHKICMLTAFFLGCLFLIGYIVYHSSVPSTSYGGEGNARILYYFLLISHILFSIGVVPFVLMALFYALKNKIDQHKRIVKVAYPIWLYVSITGILVYLFIRPYYN